MTSRSTVSPISTLTGPCSSIVTEPAPGSSPPPQSNAPASGAPASIHVSISVTWSGVSMPPSGICRPTGGAGSTGDQPAAGGVARVDVGVPGWPMLSTPTSAANDWPAFSASPLGGMLLWWQPQLASKIGWIEVG
ncbi:hypothetical protein [Nannocystis pusilla]|uniref:hypothetical protein n=1 Tax=Nannocystis pusilla TaxID=889268 RepID=UPI003B7B7DCC